MAKFILLVRISTRFPKSFIFSGLIEFVFISATRLYDGAKRFTFTSMTRIPNPDGITHQQVKVYLTESEWKCVESKPWFFGNQNNVYFVVRIDGARIRLKVRQHMFYYGRVDSAWVYWAAFIAHVATGSFLQVGILMVFVFFGLFYFLSITFQKGNITDLSEEIDQYIQSKHKAAFSRA